MEWAALIAWVVTAGLGFVMLAIWVARGGVAQARQPGSRIRPPLIFSHFGLAAAGLVVWIIYLVVDRDVLAWISFAALVVVALLGAGMFSIWLARRRTARPSSVGNPDGVGDVPAEQHFPGSVVALHGLTAAATLVLVLLTAIGVGE